jgi:hypothetical protein
MVIIVSLLNKTYTLLLDPQYLFCASVSITVILDFRARRSEELSPSYLFGVSRIINQSKFSAVIGQIGIRLHDDVSITIWQNETERIVSTFCRAGWWGGDYFIFEE